jgi:DNA-binding beta-propeller fold protein YncE
MLAGPRWSALSRRRAVPGATAVTARPTRAPTGTKRRESRRSSCSTRATERSASSFPSNQFSPRLVDSPDQPLWLNVDREVRALAAGGFGELADVETDSGANWLERTPDGSHLVVSAREPTHAQFRIDADPGSDSFGEVTGRIDLGGSAFVGTWDPAREYLYVPVQTADEVAVIEHASGEITTRLDVGAQPYGATATTVRPDLDANAALSAALARLTVGTREFDTTYCIGNCACGHTLE